MYTGFVAERGAGPTLRVRLLGGLEVEGVDPRALGSRKGRRVLALLALTPDRAVATDRIVDAVWDGAPPARPGEQVSVLVSRLRQALGPERLRRVDAGYALALDWLDLAALRDLVAEAERRLAAGGWPAARTAADAALALVRGPLLPEEAEWCAAERAEAVRLAGRARLAAATAALGAGDVTAAADLSKAALDIDPYDEAALRLHMTACAAAGRPALALAAYAETRALLRDELGANPAPATEDAHAAVLADRVPDGHAVGTVAPVAPPGDATLPGRDAELRALDAALDRVRGGRPEVVVVEGEAGIGKTRLLATWVAAQSVTVLTARCDELGRAVPLQPVLDALAAYLRSLPRDDAVRVIGDGAGLLGPLLGVSGVGAPVVPSAEGIAQAVLYAALLGAFDGIGGPVALVLDDAHLLDAASAGWLRLAHRRAGALLVVLGRRPAEGPPIEAGTTIALGPLDRAAAALAVGADRAKAVYERSGGHPLFLVELAAADDDAAMPESLRAAVAERCERAGPDVAATLRAAAVLGPEVDLDLLCAVLARPPVEILDHLEEGARRRLLEERGPSFAFRHALVREALAAATSASRRALLHREAARFLDARPGVEPLAVVYHARLGGDHDLAARALATAAGVATSRFDYAEAVRLLDEAVALADTPALRRQRAHALIRASRPAEGAADAALALAADPCAASYDVASLAAYVATPRDFGRALALADEGARVATTAADRATCLAAAGRVAMSMGDLDGAEERMRAADLPAAPAPAAATIGVFTGALAYLRGAYADADRLLAAQQRPPGQDQVWPVHLLQFRALALAGRGRPLDALDLLARQDVEAERLQMRRVAGRADNCRGYVYRGLAAFAAADDANVIGVERAAGVEQAEAQAHGLLDLAAGCLLRGDLAGAAGHLDRAAPLQAVEHALRWRHVLRTALLRGRLALADGRYDDASANAVAVLDDASERGVRRYQVLARLLAAEAALRHGDGVDLDTVANDLGALDDLAGLEAWRLTADLAAAAGVDAWHGWAGERLARLAAAAGPYADGLRRYAASVL